jgi:catechol 2,3-dioxygenase-like lactoylglutathione lyase family enzyme
LNIDHVLLAIPPGGEDEARAFFVGLLGMIEEEKPAGLQTRHGCWFRLGSCQIHVGVDEDFRPQRKAHPAFVVDEIDGLGDRLNESGHDVVWDDAIAGSRRFFSADPFGNRLEFLENPIAPPPPHVI